MKRRVEGKEAMQREIQLKKWSRKQKEAMISGKMINNCSQCGLCCGLFLINLTEEEYQSGSGEYKTQFEEFGLLDNFNKATACGANILKQKENSNCIYFKRNKCSIHKIRPQVCREFFCSSKLKKFKKMIEQIERKRTGLEKRKK